MISKYAPKRTKNLIQKDDINEDIKLIPGTDDYYATKSGNIYREYPNGYYPMKQFLNKRNGYLYVCLQIDGDPITMRLHRLIAKTWIPNPNNYPVVGHKDNDKANDCVDNLYWTTYSENSQKAVDDNLLVNDKGYDDSQSHPIIVYYTNFNEIARYGSERECHRDLGVSVSTISRHCRGMIKTKSRSGYYFRYQDT